MLTALLRLEPGKTNTSEIDGDLLGIMVSKVRQGGEKIKDDDYGTSGLLRICEQCNDTVKKVNSTLLDIAAFTQLTTTCTVTKKSPRLKAFMLAQHRGRECQAAARTFVFPNSFFTYDRNNVLAQQNWWTKPCRLLYIPVAVRTGTLYISHIIRP